MPRFSVHRHYPPASQIRSLKSMTFESSRHRDWSARAPSMTNQSRTPARSLRFHRSRSLRSTPGRTGDNDRTPDQTRHLCIKTEPWGDTLIPPTLSEKEKTELVGKCYLCKELGHMAQNCPQSNKVKSNSGKPPGASNFSIEFDNEVKVLESLPLGMVIFESQEAANNWCTSYLDWDQLGAQTWSEIGDCYAMMAEYILTIQQLYPRDECYHPVSPPYKHFDIYNCTPSNYLIVD